MSNIYPFCNNNINGNDIIMLDTCFVLNYFNYNDNDYLLKQCNTLIDKVIKEKAIFVISVKTQEELINVTLKHNFNIAGFKNEKDIKKLKINNENEYKYIIDTSYNNVDSYLHQLKGNPAFYNEIVGNITTELLEQTKDIQLNYSMHGSADATQIAIAVKENINYIATTDKDFAKSYNLGVNILVDKNTYRQITNTSSSLNATSTNT